MWRKADKQTHLEFARDLIAHFTRPCSSLNVHSFNDLSDLIVLEQFKNAIPEGIATYIAEQKVKMAMEAAALPDAPTHVRVDAPTPIWGWWGLECCARR